MKLAPKTEIKRHTDKVDKDFETKKIVRFHLPLDDNNDVSYHLWKGRTHTQHRVSSGNLYYLDVRLPHGVNNPSNRQRINLVIDVFVNMEIKMMLGLF